MCGGKWMPSGRGQEGRGGELTKYFGFGQFGFGLLCLPLGTRALAEMPVGGGVGASLLGVELQHLDVSFIGIEP